MKYFYRLLVALIALPVFTFAQSNYKPGYIIKAKGDTLRGFVNYKEWLSNPKTIQFKSSSSASVQTVTPANTNLVVITGLESYERYAGSLSMDETEIRSFEAGRDTSFKTDTIFLKVLQKGKNVTLYSFIDAIKTRFFIKETSVTTQPDELLYRNYHFNNRVVSEKDYIKQLYNILNKFNITSESVIKDVETSDYRKDNLLKIVSAINNISSKEFNEKYTDKTTVLFYAGAGANITSIKTNTIRDNEQPVYTTALPFIAAGIDVLANPNTGKLIFRLEGVAAESKYKLYFKNVTYPYTPLNYSFSMYNFIISPQIIYNFYNKENFKVYAGPGMQIAFVSYTNQKYYSIDGTSFNSVDPMFIFRKSYITPLIKAGVKIKKRLDFSVSYQFADEITNSPNSGLTLSAFMVGVKYYFNK